MRDFSSCEAEEARISGICKLTTTKQGGKDLVRTL
jgi:hypothetical protein